MRSMRAIRRICFGLLIAAAGGRVLHLPSHAQERFNEREVKGLPSELDKNKEDTPPIWSFDFRFKDPRLIKVHVPGKGTRIYWYMWYQVINRTGKLERFTPVFDLVTLDYPAVYTDEVSVTVQDAIKRVEDPTGYQDIKNSVSISTLPIPLSKSDAFPRAVTGVAIWDSSPVEPAKNPTRKGEARAKTLSDATRFSVFVRGLSNGFVENDPIVPGDPPIVRYKTLQLNFRRIGEQNSLDARDITFVPPAEWVYRPGRQKTPANGAEAKPNK